MAENYRYLYRNVDDSVKSICIDEFGFIIDSRGASMRNERSMKIEWYEIIDCYGNDKKKFRDAIKKKGLLQRGVPLSLKNRIWKYLLIPSYKVFSPTDQLAQSPENDLRHCTGGSEYDVKYNELVTQESSYEYQIHVDIQRTFRHHFLFYNKYGKGQCELFNVLVAFANRFKKIGYCQGLSDIGAIFLMYFQEDEAFVMLEALIKKNKLEGLFDKNLTNVPNVIKLQNSIFKSIIPELTLHLERNAENFTLHLIGWYITLFARFDIKLTLRIWDYLMFYGFNCLIYFTAAILKYHEKCILECSDENLIQFLGKIDQKSIDENIIVDLAVRFMEENKYKSIKKSLRILCL